MSMTVGGQAVIEGVMMRTPGSMAVAVRRADGRIEIRDEPWTGLNARFAFLKAPFLRGGLVLAESMHNGMSALTWAAERMEIDEAAHKERRHARRSTCVAGREAVAHVGQPHGNSRGGWCSRGCMMCSCRALLCCQAAA